MCAAAAAGVPELAVIWIHYQTPELLMESIESVYRDVRGMSLSVEAVVVENGNWDGAALENASMPVKFVNPGENLGYAGGVNAGVRATAARLIIILNPDVLVLPGCIQQLVDALRVYAIVGPSLFLDRDRRFRLPPNEQRGFLYALLGVLADRYEFFAAIGRRQWRKHARRFQRESGRIESYELSGAMLGFHRKTWELLGAWDDAYRLYFEETEWLGRARRFPLPAAYVAAAKAIHMYAQSTKKSPHADTWFRESSQRYELRHYDPVKRMLLKIARALPPRGTVEGHRSRSDDYPTSAAWLELSNSPKGYPAAVAQIVSPRAYRAEFERFAGEQLHRGRYNLRWLDDRGKELAENVLVVY